MGYHPRQCTRVADEIPKAGMSYEGFVTISTLLTALVGWHSLNFPLRSRRPRSYRGAPGGSVIQLQTNSDILRESFWNLVETEQAAHRALLTGIARG
jgi:hypothetical protein